MATKQTNGGWAKIAAVLISILLTGLVTVQGWTINRVIEIERSDRSAMHAHEQLAGHPAMVARVSAIQSNLSELRSDTKEIKRDVNTLLMRGGG